MLILVLILLALMREQILELATGSCQLLLRAKYPQENFMQIFHKAFISAKYYKVQEAECKYLFKMKPPPFLIRIRRHAHKAWFG